MDTHTHIANIHGQIVYSYINCILNDSFNKVSYKNAKHTSQWKIEYTVTHDDNHANKIFTHA